MLHWSCMFLMWGCVLTILLWSLGSDEQKEKSLSTTAHDLNGKYFIVFDLNAALPSSYLLIIFPLCLIIMIRVGRWQHNTRYFINAIRHDPKGRSYFGSVLSNYSNLHFKNVYFPIFKRIKQKLVFFDSGSLSHSTHTRQSTFRKLKNVVHGFAKTKINLMKGMLWVKECNSNGNFTNQAALLYMNSLVNLFLPD